jgi:hypothetical protein
MDYKRYDREFKLNAIKLHREGNKSMNALAKDLGVPLSTYSGWIKIKIPCHQTLPIYEVLAPKINKTTATKGLNL